MKFFDAHNHLQDPRLAAVVEGLPQHGIEAAVVNGTCEEDWEAVAQLAGRHPWIRPAFGIHPWFVRSRSKNWKEKLLERVTAGASIGEIGLDRAINPEDFPEQVEVFRWQLALATQRQIPVSIHCLKAWGHLWDIIRSEPLPNCGFLLHSFAGPPEMIHGFVRFGARFSFSPYFLSERKARQRASFAQIPLDRLLAETDAPDMAPPPQCQPLPLCDAKGNPLNHPANLKIAYSGLAETLQMPVEELASRLRVNFLNLFGEVPPGSPSY